MSIPVAIVTVVVGLLTVAVGGLWSLKRENISGAKEVTESALLLIQPQSQRITELTEAVNKMVVTVQHLQLQVEILEDHIESLSKQIIELGHTPVVKWERENNHGIHY